MWLKALIGRQVLGLLTLLLVGLFIAVVCLGQDEPVYDDTALQPASVGVGVLAPQKNAFYFYDKAQSKIQGFEEGIQQRLKNMLRGKTPWDNHFARQLLRQNEAALALFEQGQGLPGFQQVAPSSLQGSLGSSAQFSASKLQFVVDLKRMQIVVLERRGNNQQALKEILGLMQMARQLHQPDWMLLAFSARLQSLALDDLGALLQTSKISTVTLVSLIPQLEGYRLSVSPLAEALKQEYQFQTQEVLGAIRREVKGGKPSGGSGVFYFYLPNQTRRVVTQYYEQLLSTIKAPYWHSSPAHIQPVAWWNIGMPNVLGRMIIDIGSSENGDRPLYEVHILNTRLSLTQIWIALQLYKAEHGQWPGSLSALTPRYLRAVPVDTLTGKAIQYDLEQRTIYSAFKQGAKAHHKLAMSFQSRH